MAKKGEDEHRTAKRIATIIIIILLLLLLIPRFPPFPIRRPDGNPAPDPTTEPLPIDVPEPVAEPQPEPTDIPVPEPEPADIPQPEPTPQSPELPQPTEPLVVVPPLPHPVDVPTQEPIMINGTGGTIPIGFGDFLGYGILISIPILGKVIEPIMVGIGSLLGGTVPPAPAQTIRSPTPQDVIPEHFYEFLQASSNYFYMNEYGMGLIPTKMVPLLQINSALDGCFYNLSREYGGEKVSNGWKYRVTDTPNGKEGTVFYGNYIIIRFYGEDYVNEEFLRAFAQGLIDNPYKSMEKVPVPKPDYYRNYVIVMSGNNATVGFRNSSYSYPYSIDGSVVTVRMEGTPAEVLDFAENMTDRRAVYWVYSIEQRPSGLYRFIATSPEGRAFVYHSASVQDIEEVISLFDKFPSP